MSKYDCSTPELYQVYFKASEYSALVVALRVSGLKEEKEGEDVRHPDFVIERSKLVEDWASFRSYEQAAVENGALDSCVQLYRNNPREAQWIPVCERLLGGIDGT